MLSWLISIKNFKNSRPVKNSGTVGVDRTYPISSAFTSRLSPFSSSLEILGEPAGHHLTLRVHTGQTEQDLVSSAAAAGVGVYPVSPYFLGEIPTEYRSTILLGFGGLTDQEIRQGTALLSNAWNL